MVAAAAWVYAGLALGVVLFQIALALGQPWGHLTMGGRFSGVLPGAMRIAAMAQALLLLAMAGAVLAGADQLRFGVPSWTLWGVVAISAVSMTLNLITPSSPERLLWGPVTVAMLALVLVVAFGANRG